MDTMVGEWRLILALEGPIMIGFIRWDSHTHVVEKVWVEEPYRRQGVATALWKRAKAYDPRITHDDPKKMSGEGKAWAQKVGR